MIKVAIFVNDLPKPDVGLDPIDCQLLTDDGVPLDDPRVTVSTAAGAMRFEIRGAAGITEITWSDTPPTVNVGEGRVEGLDMDTFGRPWLVTASTGALKGCRFSSAGEAVRAALRSWRWPARWDRDAEPIWPTRESEGPAS